MREKELDALILYSGGVCSLLQPSYLYYLTQFRPMGPRNALVISKFGEAVLLVEPEWDALRAKAKCIVGKVRGSNDFIRDLTDIVRGFGVAGTIGIAGSKDMTQDVYEALEKEAEVVTAEDIFAEIAREKSAEEIEVVRKTAKLSDIGFNALLEHARVGIREYELAAEMEFAMRNAGADDIFILISSGQHNIEMHEPRDRRIENGDIIIGEITPAVNGQFFQLCRTIVVGDLPPLVLEKYAMLVDALQETLKHLKAGEPASLISSVMNEVISKAGYAEYCYPPHMRARGHGFGVGSIAPGGLIDDNTKTLLEKDQVIVIHPNQYLPEVGYLACGETYLITDSCAEKLSETETKLYINKG